MRDAREYLRLAERANGPIPAPLLPAYVWGDEGLAQTLATLACAGVRSAGAGLDERGALALPAGRALVFACATADSGVPEEQAARAGRRGVAWLPDCGETSCDRLAERIAAQRRADDLVVVSIHWGANWVREVPAAQRAFARRLLVARDQGTLSWHALA